MQIMTQWQSLATGTGDIYMRVNAAHEVSALYKYKTQDVQKAAEEAVAQVKALGGSGYHLYR